MDSKQNPQIAGAEENLPRPSATELKAELKLSKEQLATKAQELSLKQYAANHPYIAIGTAFLTGMILSGSKEARGGLFKGMFTTIGKEVIQRKNFGKF